MLDSRVLVQLEKDLVELGLDGAFTPVSSFPKVEVKIGLEVLQALIAKAQATCTVCGSVQIEQ